MSPQPVIAASLGEDQYGLLTIEVGACSAFAFLVWDMLLNLDAEIDYVWRSRNSWSKWLYLFIRHMPYLAIGFRLWLGFYVSWMDLQYDGKCRASVIFDGIVVESLIFATDVILTVRVYAMFNHHRVLVVALITLFITYITASATVLAISISHVEFMPQCIVTSIPDTVPVVWYMALAFETTLFTLTLIKVLFWLSSVGLHRQSVVVILARDGAWAYAVIFGAFLLNAIIYKKNKNTLSMTLLPWIHAVMSFTGSHVLLNLRRFAVEPHYSLLSRVNVDLSTARSQNLEFGDPGGNSALEELEAMSY
ncbi:hypothetical protein C8Q74DRAFT_1303532 [Fomes fomentarius]|nr:hypothetical protein C8Q74DRAFT_1303532 [Fomes fomentarius]